MKFKSFTYEKKKDKLTKKYFVLILNDSENHIGGIDLGKLEDSEIEVLLGIQKEYEAKMEPFVKKAYRKYIKENMSNEDSNSNPQQLLSSK